MILCRCVLFFPCSKTKVLSRRKVNAIWLHFLKKKIQPFNFNLYCLLGKSKLFKLKKTYFRLLNNCFCKKLRKQTFLVCGEVALFLYSCETFDYKCCHHYQLTEMSWLLVPTFVDMRFPFKDICKP